MSTTAQPTPGPARRPLRPAIATVVVAAALTLVIVAGLVFGLSERTLMEMAAGSMAGEVAFVLALMGLWALEAGLSLAAFILAVLVVVRGTGSLRRGGILVLVGASLGLVGMFAVSFETYGDSSGPSAIETVVMVITVVGGIVRGVLLLAGAAIMVPGIGRIRRERADAART